MKSKKFVERLIKNKIGRFETDLVKIRRVESIVMNSLLNGINIGYEAN